MGLADAGAVEGGSSSGSRLIGLQSDDVRPNIPGLYDSVWDPRQKMADRYHLMPIITPPNT